MSERQKLLKIRYEILKNLKKMTISFEGNAVTGIFGPNGCGKTTILHSLLCMYQPKTVGVGENHLFKEFFKTDNQFSYIGSKMTLFYESQANERKRSINVPITGFIVTMSVLTVMSFIWE